MLSALLLACAATATAYNATGPYGLHITGKEDSSIDGESSQLSHYTLQGADETIGYAGACHAGAAIEGLCYIAGELNDTTTYQQFNFNYSSYDSTTGEVYPYGWLEWELPLSTGTDGETTSVPSALQIGLNLGSNVNVALFYPGYDTYTSLQKSENGTLYIPGGVDDTQNTDTYPNPVVYQGNLTNWYLCYQFTGGYYYQSIAWVNSLPPQNPTCAPVDLTLQTLGY